MRNVGLSNEFRRLTIARHYLIVLLTAGFPVLVVVIFLLARFSSHLREDNWVTGANTVHFERHDRSFGCHN